MGDTQICTHRHRTNQSVQKLFTQVGASGMMCAHGETTSTGKRPDSTEAKSDPNHPERRVLGVHGLRGGSGRGPLLGHRATRGAFEARSRPARGARRRRRDFSRTRSLAGRTSRRVTLGTKSRFPGWEPGPVSNVRSAALGPPPTGPSAVFTPTNPVHRAACRWESSAPISAGQSGVVERVDHPVAVGVGQYRRPVCGRGECSQRVRLACGKFSSQRHGGHFK